MRVLIVKTSALGDIIHALPVLDYLHQVVSGIEVDWVVEERFVDILSGNPLVSQLFTVDTKKWRKKLLSPVTWREISSLRQQLEARRYSIVFDIQGNFKSGLIAKFSGCSRRYGFDAEAVRESLNLKFTTNQVPLRRQDYHVTDRSLRVVSVPFGKDYSALKLGSDIVTDSEEDQSAELFLATLNDGLVFLFHPGTTWVTKLWHESGWIALGKELTDKFPESTILISSGGGEEKQVAENIKSGIGRQTRLLPQLSIKGFTAIIKKVDLMFGGDTGPIHLAAAVATPTVSFYRATDGKRNGPRGDIHRIVQSPLPCTKCLLKQCGKDQSCRESIDVNEMLGAAEELLLSDGR
ncbi:MAG: lipopolysaccharide heptosyltransferase I [Geobacteraceae bacterium]|nr:lipopolysaccharide heptosyltransferase I [Geobacteraceae bacterium]